MSPTLGQCSNHCITREKHFKEHSNCSSKWKVTARTLWISQVFFSVYLIHSEKYPILEALWAFPGCKSWENQNHLHQLQSWSWNSSFPPGNNPSNLMVTGRSKLCVNHCVCSKCKPPWLNYHHLPLQQTSK